MRARTPLVTLTLLLLAVLSAAGRQAAAVELLPNGDFSNGTDGWTAYGLTFDTACAGNVADPGAGLQVDGDGWLRSDAVAIEPGGTYVASGYAHFMAGSDPSSRLWLALAFYQTADSNSEIPPRVSSEPLPADTLSYTSLTAGPQTAPAGAHFARLRVQLSTSAPASACVDDLSLDGPLPSPTQTPTPTVPVPSPTPTSLPTATASPTATEVPMPSGSILNGGFEEGVDDLPAAWQKFGGFLYRSTAVPRSGSYAGAFSSNTASTKWVYQPFSVDAGRSYAFHGFVLKGGPPDSIVFLRISWYASVDASGSSIASSDSPESLTGSDPFYRYLATGPATAPADARSARARIVLVPASGVSETIYLDDFALEEAAPPAPASGDADGAAASDDQALVAPEPSPGLTTDLSEVAGAARSPARFATTPTPAARGSRAYEDSPYAVKISEVLANAGAGIDDAASEWIELYNAGPASVELRGWSLVDNVDTDVLPPAALPPGAYAVVAASSDFRNEYPAFGGTLLVLPDGRTGNGLANEGDRLLLLDEEGRPVDAISYGTDREFFDPPSPAVPPGHSLERFPSDRDTDTAVDFRDNAQPSPGSGPPLETRPTATATRFSEVLGTTLSTSASGGGPSWIWLVVAGGLVFGGGTGAGAAGVLFWLARVRRS